MADPTPVDVKNAEPIKVAIADAGAIPPIEGPKPTVEKTTETHETVKTVGDAAATSQVALGARFDDWVRFALAQEVVAGFIWMVLYGQFTGRQPDQNTMLVYVSFVSLSLGFYLGSSYGRNLEKKAGAV